MYENSAQFRFYNDLNDFLPSYKKKKSLHYRFNGKPSVKDSIEAQGVPHTEVEFIVVDGLSVGFNYQLMNGDQVSVYSYSNSLDITNKVRLREDPEIKFISDVHLGKLVRILRMLGFDSLYRNDYADHQIVSLADKEKRIVLTRDRRLLKFRNVTHGYWLRSTISDEQISEVLKRYDLFSDIKPFHRCLECNGIIEPIDKESIVDQLEPKTKQYYNEFYNCLSCRKIYWKGSHYNYMTSYLDKLRP